MATSLKPQGMCPTAMKAGMDVNMLFTKIKADKRTVQGARPRKWIAGRLHVLANWLEWLLDEEVTLHKQKWVAMEAKIVTKRQ